MFQHLKDNNISKIDKFRADAFYQYDFVKLVGKTFINFISGPKQIWKKFALIEDWIKTKDQTGEDFYIGK
ncbi:MAG: hypothetical protein IPF52_01235 [Saprospiraceae bacterium]|nr:hypothetical protein [Saprospiraceae bacterium]